MFSSHIMVFYIFRSILRIPEVIFTMNFILIWFPIWFSQIKLHFIIFYKNNVRFYLIPGWNFFSLRWKKYEFIPGRDIAVNRTIFHPRVKLILGLVSSHLCVNLLLQFLVFCTKVPEKQNCSYPDVLMLIWTHHWPCW